MFCSENCAHCQFKIIFKMTYTCIYNIVCYLMLKYNKMSENLFSSHFRCILFTNKTNSVSSHETHLGFSNYF